MLRQSFIYLILSMLVVIFARYIHFLIVYLDIAYTYANLQLAPFFSQHEAGILLRNIIILTLLPILLTSIPALIYKGIKGGTMPYYVEATWIIWFLIVISKIIIL